MEKNVAGVVACAIAVTAGGGFTIVAEGWPQAVLVALAIGAAFGLGTWSARPRDLARQDGIADALLQVVGDDPTGRYLRTLPENDPNGDRMDDWDALVRQVSRLCNAEIDTAEVAAGLRALVAAA